MFGENIKPVTTLSSMLTGLRLQVYEIVHSGLQKRLPEEEVAVAAMYLWSVVHGLSLLLIDGQVSPTSDKDELIRSVLLMSGTGIPPSS